MFALFSPEILQAGAVKGLNLLSTLCILIEILSRAHDKRGKSLNDFTFGTFISRFPSDGAACMAMKGLKVTRLKGEPASVSRT